MLAPNYGPLFFKYAWVRMIASYIITALQQKGLSLEEVGVRLFQDGILNTGLQHPYKYIAVLTGELFDPKKVSDLYISSLAYPSLGLA
jgi:hypothetical protein